MKKNNNKKPEPLNFDCDSKKYNIHREDSVIRIVLVNQSLGSRFRYNSIIKSIDGNNISSENIDYYYNELNNSCDWSKYDIIAE